MQFYDKAESVATRIVEQFQSGNIPKALAQVFIKRRDNIPCRSWSWANQLLTALSGFDDARSYRDWQTSGRQVRKGERAFCILEPCKRKITKTDAETGEKRDAFAVYGFRAGARFGLEQTDIADAETWAAASKRDEAADRFLDALPLVNVARSWGLSVKSHSGKGGKYLGMYRHGQSIAIGVENLATWAHELIHAADDRLGQLSECGQHWRSETVAELGGAVLLSCIGQDHDADLGGCWDYIRRYAEENGKDATSAAMSVLNRRAEITIHHGRHSFVSHALAAGRTLAEVRDAAGHSSVGTTSIYTHVAMEDDGAVGNIFNFGEASPDGRAMSGDEGEDSNAA